MSWQFKCLKGKEPEEKCQMEDELLTRVSGFFPSSSNPFHEMGCMLFVYLEQCHPHNQLPVSSLKKSFVVGYLNWDLQISCALVEEGVTSVKLDEKSRLFWLWNSCSSICPPLHCLGDRDVKFSNHISRHHCPISGPFLWIYWRILKFEVKVTGDYDKGNSSITTWEIMTYHRHLCRLFEKSF